MSSTHGSTATQSAARVMPATVAAPWPPRPANGEGKAPGRNSSAPTQADAVPAMAPWLVSAIAVAFGRMLPKKDRKKKSGTSSAASGGGPAGGEKRGKEKEGHKRPRGRRGPGDPRAKNPAAARRHDNLGEQDDPG